jgi:hypothetical protein
MEPTHLYYNIDVFNASNGYDANGNIIYTAKAEVIDYIENRANAYLEYPDDYELSIMGFNFDNNYLPLQIVQPVLGSTFVTLTNTNFPLSGFRTVYALSVNSTTSSSGAVAIYWQPPDTTITINGPITKEQITDEYFWNYDIVYFLDLINKSIGYAVTTLNPAETVLPYFAYSSATKLISFNAPLSFTNGTYVLNMTESLQFLLGGFNYTYSSNSSFPQGYYTLNVINNNSNVIPQYNNLSGSFLPGAEPYRYVIVPQEYSTIQNWNPVSSILFLSPILPVVNEMNAVPLIFGTNPNPKTNNADMLNVLFDFVVSQKDNPSTSFEPTGQYILTSLISKHPVSELQLVMVWKDYYGKLYPLKFETGSGLSLKILFRKKDFSSKNSE